MHLSTVRSLTVEGCYFWAWDDGSSFELKVGTPLEELFVLRFNINAYSLVNLLRSPKAPKKLVPDQSDILTTRWDERDIQAVGRMEYVCALEGQIHSLEHLKITEDTSQSTQPISKGGTFQGLQEAQTGHSSTLVSDLRIDQKDNAPGNICGTKADKQERKISIVDREYLIGSRKGHRNKKQSSTEIKTIAV